MACLASSKVIIKNGWEKISDKGLNAGNVSVGSPDTPKKVINLNSLGKIQNGQAHFGPWENLAKNIKIKFSANICMMVC